MKWITLKHKEQIENLLLQKEIAVIFKHSTRCIISKSVLADFETKFNSTKGVSFYYLDILNYRNLSNLLEEKCDIMHQSPQIIILKNGKPLAYHSHYNIISNFNLEAYKQ